MAGNGRQYAEILVNGKTGSRAIQLINSIPYVKDIIDSHPMKNSPNAYLIYNEKAFGRSLSIYGLFHMYKRYETLVFPSLLEDPLLDTKDKTKIQELLKKPWNPYIRRHSALTEIQDTKRTYIKTACRLVTNFKHASKVHPLLWQRIK